MRKSWKLLSLVLILALVLPGCRSRDKDTANNTGTTPPSQSIGNAPSGNDAMNGGGAGGVNDPNGNVTHTPTPNPNATLTPDPQATGGLADDVGNAVGDVGNAVGDVVEGVGDAVGNAADGMERGLRNR